jgi:hypothetical protein
MDRAGAGALEELPDLLAGGEPHRLRLRLRLLPGEAAGPRHRLRQLVAALEVRGLGQVGEVAEQVDGGRQQLLGISPAGRLAEAGAGERPIGREPLD